MKRAAIFLVLYLISALRGQYYGGQQQIYEHFKNKKTKHYDGKYQYVDSNSPKIPTLMEPSKSIGLLPQLEIDLADKCFPKPWCNASARFRTIDGSCNNLRFPVWGQSHTSYIRIIQASYADDNRQPRKAKSGYQLPNARHVRQILFGQDVDKPSAKYNLFTMQFGQIIAHDTVLSTPKTLRNGDKLECCNSDGSSPKVLHKDCLQITVPPNERQNKRCFSAPRMTDTSDRGCDIQPVRQVLDTNSFIDGSLLYGVDDKMAKSLRTFKNGKLKSQMGPKNHLYLPNVEKPTKTCNVIHDDTVCYLAGDPRVNQLPGLAVTTTSLLRVHNVLCDELEKINPSWNDERMYQEARRILIGMYQHITYNEYIPIILGRDYARINHLLPLREDFEDNYEEFLNPTTMTSFAAAAFRAFHSNIQGFIELVNEARRTTSKIRLSDYFFKTDIVHGHDNYDSFVRGMLTQPSQELDQLYTEEITEYLVKLNKTYGGDLVSADLQRSREFGLPGYNKFRELCGLKKAQHFDDLIDQITQKNIDALANLYEHVDDIDFYAAGILEKPKDGAMVGHTFQCIIGEMFFRWKFGDRFYYEFGDQPGSFSRDQLKEIRKTTLATIMCMSSNIKSIQQNAFEIPNYNKNPLVSCNHIPKLNLNAWEE